MPATFQELMGPADPFNPEVSIQAQALYMKQLLVRYGRDLEKAYAAYNWGMGNLDRCLQDHSGDWRGHLPDETAQYLARIAGLREELVREALPRA
jgi:soluble lytic murein transglycosylase-like protein